MIRGRVEMNLRVDSVRKYAYLSEVIHEWKWIGCYVVYDGCI